MKVEITKTDWGVPCKEYWTAPIEGTKSEVNEALDKMFTDGLKSCIDMDDKEFLSYNIYIDGEFHAGVYEFLEFNTMLSPHTKVAKLFALLTTEKAIATEI